MVGEQTMRTRNMGMAGGGLTVLRKSQKMGTNTGVAAGARVAQRAGQQRDVQKLWGDGSGLWLPGGVHLPTSSM
jgi:hypothetical protein